MPEIRDMRRRRWFYVDNDLIDHYLPLLGASAFAVYAVLCRMANNETQDCWPSHATISARTGLSVNTIRTGLAKLAELGLVEVSERLRPDGSRTSNLYTLIEPEAELSKTDMPPSNSGRGVGFNSGTPAPYQKVMKNYPNDSELSSDEGGDDLKDGDVMKPPGERPKAAEPVISAQAAWAVIEPALLEKGGMTARSLLQHAEAMSLGDGMLIVALASAMTVTHAETRLFLATQVVLKARPELGVKKVTWVARRNGTRGGP